MGNVPAGEEPQATGVDFSAALGAGLGGNFQTLVDPGNPGSPKTEQHEETQLYVTVIEAKNLGIADIGGTSDPFTVVTTSSSAQKFKTKVINKNLNPAWHETFSFYTLKPTGVVKFELFDKDLWTQEFLGRAEFSLDQLKNGHPTDIWLDIKDEPGLKHKTDEKPQLHVKVHFPVKNPEETKHKKKAKKQRRRTRIREYYDVGKVIGKGGFSIVKNGTNKETHQVVAIKILKKHSDQDEAVLLANEIDIHTNLSHQNIVRLYEFFETHEYVYLVLEMITGGELFDLISKRGYLEEHEAAFILKQSLKGLDYIHTRGIVHRDLKPENLLVSGQTSAPVIKIADFGSSSSLKVGDSLNSFVGTIDYLAPEVILGKPYDFAVDIWAMGVITYVILAGFTPFDGETMAELFPLITKGQYDFEGPEWDAVSDKAKKFVKRLMQVDPKLRPTAAEALQDEWIKEHTQPAPAETKTSATNLKRLQSVAHIQKMLANRKQHEGIEDPDAE